MDKSFYKNLSKILFIAVLVFSIYSCDSTTVTPTTEANTISGTITFADTNFITSGGVYDIGAFSNPSTPPTYWFGPPTAYDTLVITNNNGVYSANYKLTGVPDGNFVIAVGFRKDTGGQSPIMGVYGCDTAHTSCFLDPQRVTITNNAGVSGINFISWADTANKVY